jgi:hypothetical protein
VPLATGEVIVAVQFLCDRAPYVVRTKQSPVEFEVPLREGTRTRTARRDELLQIIGPVVEIPRLEPLEAHLAAVDVNADEGGAPEVVISGTVRLFAVYAGVQPQFLPSHEMGARFGANGLSSAQMVVQPLVGETAAATPSGPLASRDGVSISGPGTFEVKVEFRTAHARAALLTTRRNGWAKLEMRFGVLGAHIPAHCEIDLAPAGDMGPERHPVAGFLSWHFERYPTYYRDDDAQ